MSDRPAVAVVPRERFSEAARSLDTILPTLGPQDQLVYVDGKSPRPSARAIAERQRHHGFKLLRTERYLSPNEARNLALFHAETPYVVFVDNDLLVTPDWLDRMVHCAEETGAAVVGPLCFEGDPADRVIHITSGEMTLEGPHGSRTCHTEQRFQGSTPEELTATLERCRCDFVEFHCMLVRTEVMERLGPLDEGLRNTREHLDLCLDVAGAGGEVWFEPSAEVTFSNPPPVPLRDVPYYWLRWSDRWTAESMDRFCEKRGIDPAYKRRGRIIRSRRQIALLPVRRATESLTGRWGGAAMGKGMRMVEPLVNRLIYR